MKSVLTPADERWLAALAGRRPCFNPADDEGLAEAAQLRAALLHPAGPPLQALDPVTLTRVMNGLQARGTFDVAARRAAAARSPGHGAVQVWPAVLAGPRVHDGLRALWGTWAVPTAATVGVLAALWLEGFGGSPQDPGMLAHKGAIVAIAQQVHSQRPDAEASHLVSLLATRGVVAEVRAEGADRVVEAALPVALLQEIEPALQAEGLNVPRDGQLVVRYQAALP